MTRAPRVLFVGADFCGSNATSLRNAILRSGHECVTINMWEPNVRARVRTRALGKPEALTPSQQHWNDSLIRTANAWRADLMVVFKGLWLSPETLVACPGRKVHYHPDDSSNPYNRSPVYDRAEAHYDLHVTTKSFNVSELQSRGSRDVLFVRCAYDRDWHRPVRRQQPIFDVGFIGTRRSDRLPLIRDVAGRWGKRFLLAGGRWHREPGLVRRATVRPPQYGVDMSIAVAAAPVQLGLLNSDNRDQHTCRSYEIPAAGGAMIAERTPEHQEMLEEGREALFFAEQAELMEHIERLSGDRPLARQISEAAAHRIRGGGNTYEDRWQAIVKHLS